MAVIPLLLWQEEPIQAVVEEEADGIVQQDIKVVLLVEVELLLSDIRPMRGKNIAY